MSKCECCKEENSNLITYEGYKMCATCYMSYVSNVKVCENNAKYETEIDQLKQQLAEKDKVIENLKQEINEWVGHKFVKLQYQKAIQELEKIEELLLDEYKKYPIVYDKTDDLVCGALDRDKTIEIINQQIKELKGE